MSSPVCDLSCVTKIIIDGDMIAKVLEVTCEGIESFLDHGGHLDHSNEIHTALIDLEDRAYKFQRLVLEKGMGYPGPWPKALS